MFLKNKKTRTLVLVMSVLFILTIIIAQWNYRDVNASVDPRIKPARELYKKYNGYAQSGNYDSLFYLMDTIESIYRSLPHYCDSWETGVLYNNRAAAWLTMGIYDSSLLSSERDSLILLGEKAAKESIAIYQEWKSRYADLGKEAIRAELQKEMRIEKASPDPDLQFKYLQSRLQDMLDAQAEIDRRLSVSYTNLGVVHRHYMRYDSAAVCYKQALELWNRNLTAENNLNNLLGQPQKKRNFIQRMFPPERL